MLFHIHVCLHARTSTHGQIHAHAHTRTHACMCIKLLLTFESWRASSVIIFWCSAHTWIDLVELWTCSSIPCIVVMPVYIYTLVCCVCMCVYVWVSGCMCVCVCVCVCVCMCARARLWVCGCTRLKVCVARARLWVCVCTRFKMCVMRVCMRMYVCVCVCEWVCYFVVEQEEDYYLWGGTAHYLCYRGSGI